MQKRICRWCVYVNKLQALVGILVHDNFAQSRRLERAASTDGAAAPPAAGDLTPQVQSPEGAPWALSPTGGAITTLLHTPGAP